MSRTIYIRNWATSASQAKSTTNSSPLSHRLMSGDQVEVLTSQSQKPSPDWLKFLATAKAKTSLRSALRRERMPVIERGRKIYDEFLSRNGITDTNEITTKLLGLFHLPNKEELLYSLGAEEIDLDDPHFPCAKVIAKQGQGC